MRAAIRPPATGPRRPCRCRRRRADCAAPVPDPYAPPPRRRRPRRRARSRPPGPARRPRQLAIYFDAGTEDQYGFAEPNGALDRLMQEHGIAHTFRLVQGGGHAWRSDKMLDNLERSLKFVTAAISGAQPAAPADSKPAAPGSAQGGDKGGDKGSEKK